MPELGSWISVKELAAAWKRSRMSIYYYIKFGRLKHRHRVVDGRPLTQVKFQSRPPRAKYGAVASGKLVPKVCSQCRRD